MGGLKLKQGYLTACTCTLQWVLVHVPAVLNMRVHHVVCRHRLCNPIANASTVPHKFQCSIQPGFCCSTNAASFCILVIVRSKSFMHLRNLTDATTLTRQRLPKSQCCAKHSGLASACPRHVCMRLADQVVPCCAADLTY